ncbi:hypothetical protein TR2A62_2739 [Thalassobium sp. R2A62]|nr:hypothetical protein TR2A62_2739 [Thalassobium sp. R2A62]
MKHRSHRQVFAPDRSIDDTLQPFDGTEGINRPPISARAIMILH